MDTFFTKDWQNLSRVDIRSSLQEWTQKDVDRILLKSDELQGLKANTLAVQWHSFKALKSKAPKYLESEGLMLPPKMFVEQCSSEASCLAKNELAKELGVKSIVDITGGLGIDAFYMAKKGIAYTHIEQHRDLQACALNNFKAHKLDALVQSHNMDGLVFLQNKTTKDAWIYADPMRRSLKNQRSLDWEDHLPNPFKVLEAAAASKAAGLIIKLSPMNNLSDFASQSIFEHIAVVGIEARGELKELLFIFSQESLPMSRRLYLVEGGEVHSVELTNQKLSLPVKQSSYLYLPGPGMSKFGVDKSFLLEHEVASLDPDTPVFTSKSLQNLLGYRSFEVLESFAPQDKKLKKRFSKGNYHVISKGFPSSSNELSAKLKLVPKGDLYLVFTKYDGGFIGLLCRAC